MYYKDSEAAAPFFTQETRFMDLSILKQRIRMQMYSKTLNTARKAYRLAVSDC